MKTSNGVIQGYCGVSAVDSKHQVVVSAEAYGQGQEHGLLEPMVEKIEAAFIDDKQSPLVTATKKHCYIWKKGTSTAI